MNEPTVEDRLASLVVDLERASEGGKNPQLREAAEYTNLALALVRGWADGIAMPLPYTTEHALRTPPEP